jgi:hypothetical protein
MLSGELGVRVILLVGKSVPLPAPAAVTSALTRIEVTIDEKTPSGFQMTFSLAKDGPDFGLIAKGLVDPFTKVSIGVAIGVAPIVLINGVITHHQFAPSDEPGRSTLTVTGEDVGQLLDLAELNRQYKNLPDFAIVNLVLMQHIQDGVVPPHVVMPTMQVRTEVDRIVTQQETNRAFVQRLASENGYTFYLEPITFGVSRAYWGPQIRVGELQPALTMNMGSASNVKSLSFAEDARAPVAVEGRVVELSSKMAIPLPPIAPPRLPPLALTPAPARRTRPAGGTAKMNVGDALVRILSEGLKADDAVTGSGEVDTVRYGHVLRARQLVGVRGVGHSYDGSYYVRRVSHVLSRGEYTQRFTLSREGRGALLPVVRP